MKNASLASQQDVASLSPSDKTITKVIIGVCIALVLLTVAGVFAFGSLLGPKETVPLAQLSWFLPTAQSFVILAALAIATLCLGRYRALGGAWVLLTSMAFAANAILGVFYLLAWPGLVGATGVIAQLSNTSSVLFNLAYWCVGLLVLAINVRRLEALRPTRAVALYALVAILAALIGLLAVRNEGVLPVTIIGGDYTPLAMASSGGLFVAWMAGALLAYRRLRAERDPMLGYLALFLVLMAFGILDAVAGGKRYDFWWYESRVLYGSAYVVLLFGFLQEGYALFSNERQRSKERAQLADQIEYERARWQTTVDNMLDLVTVCDAAGHVTYINPAYLALIGRFVEPDLPFEEHPKFYQIYHPDGTMFAPGDLPLQRAALDDKQAREVEVVHRTTDGREVVCLFNAAPLHDESGGVIGAVAVGRDITAQRRAEAERERLLAESRRRAAELDVANKELEAFSYSVSHDLRAPLRHIDGFGKILMESYVGQLDEQGRRYLQFMVDGSRRMSELIDAILQLSRVTRAEMRRQPVNLSELATSTMAALQREQPERQAEVAIAPDASADGDPQLLQVLLENLLGNAWKFTARRPIAKIEFGLTHQDDKTVYFIKDNGAGFDMASADKLFNAFQRLHRVEDFPGTGIGLATVQRIVHRHGGRIWAESEIDKGATFYFSLG